jgi:long-chain acyl-CoA synthetase
MKEDYMEKIWLKQYPPGVPAEINPDAYSSLVALLTETCAKYKNLPAFINMGTQISYQELDELTAAFAAYLQTKFNFQKGTRVAIILPNLLQYIIALFGTLRAGGVVVNINPLYTEREMQHQLANSGAQVVVVLANFAHVLQNALTGTQVKQIIVTEIGDMFGLVKRILVNFAVKNIKKMIPDWSLPGSVAFREVLAEGKHLQLNNVPLTGEDIAFLQYTGGTTGVAKGAVLTHRNMVANIEQAYSWVAPFMHPGKEIIITALPLYHIFSLTANCLVFFKLGGKNILITNPRDMKGFVHELSKYPFTVITGVNTLFNALLNAPGFEKLDFSALHLSLGGGMQVHPSVAKLWQEVTHTLLLEAYGLTETSPAVAINPLDLKEFNGSIGLPIPSTDVKICDENGNSLPLGEAGELCVRGPQVMHEYWNMPAETAKAFFPGGWVRTGDIATMDDKGFLRITDRKKDMIIVSGFNVYPNEVESVIAGCPGVKEVAVIGVPDESSGEMVKAFVVKSDPNLTEQAVRTFCYQKLTPYKVPKKVEFREELPKSNVGKILRRALRDS